MDQPWKRFAWLVMIFHLIVWAIVMYARGWRWDPFGTREW